MTERIVHIALSQRAAKVLKGVLENASGRPKEQVIIEAILDDLWNQIERPKKRTKK